MADLRRKFRSGAIEAWEMRKYLFHFSEDWTEFGVPLPSKSHGVFKTGKRTNTWANQQGELELESVWEFLKLNGTVYTIKSSYFLLINLNQKHHLYSYFSQSYNSWFWSVFKDSPCTKHILYTRDIKCKNTEFIWIFTWIIIVHTIHPHVLFHKAIISKKLENTSF